MTIRESYTWVHSNGTVCVVTEVSSFSCKCLVFPVGQKVKCVFLFVLVGLPPCIEPDTISSLEEKHNFKNSWTKYS